MTAIKTVGDSQGWFYVLTDFDDIDIDAIDVSELSGSNAIEGTWDAAASGTRFSFTASDTVSDPAYGDESNVNAVGRSNYEGSIAPYIKLDPETGAYDESSNPLLTTLVKGKEVLVVSGVTGGPLAARAAGDLYDAFVFAADNPQKPTEVGGYQKRNIPLVPAGRSVAAAALVSA